MHPPEPGQVLHAGNVDRAPGTARRARSYPVRIADLIDAQADSVDPTKAKLLVHEFLPRDTRLPRTSLVKADEQLCCRCMVSLEPLAQLPGGGKEDWLHLAQNSQEAGHRTSLPCFLSLVAGGSLVVGVVDLRGAGSEAGGVGVVTGLR